MCLSPAVYMHMCMHICVYVCAADAKSLQSCPTLCDPMEGSPPGSSVFGIFQARVLEWGAIAFSRHSHNKALLFSLVLGRS